MLSARLSGGTWATSRALRNRDYTRYPSMVFDINGPHIVIFGDTGVERIY